MFVLNLGVLWIRAGSRHTYPSDEAFETQGAVYDRVVATSSSLAFSLFLWYAVLVLYLGLVLRWMLAVYRHIPHLRERLATLSVGYGSEASFGTVPPHGPASVKLDVKMVRFRFFVDGAGRNHVRVLAHLAQYEEANEAIITRTIFCHLLVCTPWSSFMWLLRLCRVFYSCIVYVTPAVLP